MRCLSFSPLGGRRSMISRSRRKFRALRLQTRDKQTDSLVLNLQRLYNFRGEEAWLPTFLPVSLCSTRIQCPVPPEAFADYINAAMETWAGVLKRANINALD